MGERKRQNCTRVGRERKRGTRMRGRGELWQSHSFTGCGKPESSALLKLPHFFKSDSVRMADLFSAIKKPKVPTQTEARVKGCWRSASPMTTRFNRVLAPCLFSSSALMLMACRAFPERPGVGAVEGSSPFAPLDGVSCCLGAASEDGATARLSGLPPRPPQCSPALRTQHNELQSPWKLIFSHENGAGTWERRSPWSASCPRRSCGPLWGPLHTPFYWKLRTKTIMT